MFNKREHIEQQGEMMQKQYSEIQPNNIPSYVSVYNSLYSDIMKDVYKQTELLPGENQLAQKYNVSRNTLRQALAILSEDGLIIKRQGKGTVVAERKEFQFIKNNFNPMVQLAKQPIVHILNDYNFNPPTDIAMQKLDLNANDIVLASHNVFKTKDETIGFSFVQIPTKMFDSLAVDSTKEEEVINLLNQKLFENTSKSNICIKLIFANEIEVDFLGIELNTPLLLIETLLYNATLQPLARCKFYFNPEHYNLTFQT